MGFKLEKAMSLGTVHELTAHYHTGVAVIYVSPGNVFPAYISLGMRVSPHTYP